MENKDCGKAFVAADNSSVPSIEVEMTGSELFVALLDEVVSSIGLLLLLL